MFPLVRYFSIASLTVFLVGFAVIFITTRANEIDDLIVLREENNIALSRAYANALIEDHGDFIASASALTLDEIMASEAFAALHADVGQLAADSTIVKVVIYAPDGTAVYSSDFADIGEDKSANTGFLTAMAGGAASELGFEDMVDAFDGEILDRDIVESYVPFQTSGAGAVQGVFEIYDDVTTLLSNIERRQTILALELAALMLALYVVLFFIVRYAERIMRQQRAEIEQNLAALALANDELKIANARAEEATRLKSEFLSTMSHELRTPLNAIIGYSGILASGIAGELTEKPLRMVTRIQDSGQHLLMLINNVLDISKIEAGRMTIVKNPVFVRDIAESVADQLQILAERKQLQFITAVADDVPEVLMLDEDRVKQILINLLSNAIKFTEAGSVTLDLTWAEDILTIKVTDTGVGIPPHSLDYIFDEFRQVDSTSTRNVGGTGLGLAIVRKFAVAMAGTVTVTSTVGAGSTFTVTLAAEAVVEPVPAP